MKNFFIALGMFACFVGGYVYHYYQVEQAVNLMQAEKKYLTCQKEAMIEKIGWLEADRAMLFNELTPAQRKAMRRKLERK